MDEMILRDCKDATILEYAENIRNAGNNLLGLVNDILDFSKIEAGKMEIIPVEYALSSVLNDLVNMIQKRAEKKSLKLIVKAAPELPTILYGDEIRIKQAVTNILTNAVKYTETGSVTMTVSFQKIADDKISLRFEVKDTGIGIKPEDIKKLFNAFERIEEKRNRTIEGTGLGMNITQRLLHLMGSDLEVNSVYGEGSTFAFSIEQPVINWEPLGNFEENYHNMLSKRKAYHEKFTAPTAKILVVDDTQLNLAVVKGLLKQTQIQIETAESGYECLHLVTKNHYDVIFLDHRMPGIDGIECLQKMKTLHNNLNDETPVIALTANAVSGAREQYINAGFKNYVSKPIDSAALEAMLIKYLPPDKVHIADEEDKPVEESKLPDWLSTVKGLNTKEGVKHCGSVDAYLDTLKIFADAVKSGVNEIAGFYQKSDWKNYTTKVHALKSSARVIGADELSERAKRLEDAGNSGYINEIKEGTSALLELYMSYESKLAPLIAKPVDTDDKPLISDDDLSEAVEALKESAAAFDYDGVMFVLDELDGYQLPDDQIERFKEIRDAASKLDWEALSRELSA
ncbi:MAG: response regulator, partial [Selenomonadaceae bacterium]|nr:response regulator [Selenomonadaceae bacterium]